MSITEPIETDSLGRELIHILLNEPCLIDYVAYQVPVALIREFRVRYVLSVIYRLYERGHWPKLEEVRAEIEDPRLRGLVLRLFLPSSDGVTRASWQDRLNAVLDQFAERQREKRERDLAEMREAVNVIPYAEK